MISGKLILFTSLSIVEFHISTFEYIIEIPFELVVAQLPLKDEFATIKFEKVMLIRLDLDIVSSIFEFCMTTFPFSFYTRNSKAAWSSATSLVKLHPSMLTCSFDVARINPLMERELVIVVFTTSDIPPRPEIKPYGRSLQKALFLAKVVNYPPLKSLRG